MPVEALGDRAAVLASAAIAVFLVAPILVMVPLSFTAGSLLTFPLPGLSWRWYEDFFYSPVWLSSLRNSLLLAGLTTVAATLLGTAAALGIVRLEGRWRPLVSAVLLSPLIVPVIIAAVAMFFFFARFGLVGSLLGLSLAHTALALPLVVITVTAALEGLDPNLARAAFACGAPPLRAFLQVTRPIIMPAIVTGAVFSFVTSFDEIVCVIFLGSPEFRTLPRQIWSGAKETISPTITVAAVFMVLLSLVLIAVVEGLRARSRRLAGQRW